MDGRGTIRSALLLAASCVAIAGCGGDDDDGASGRKDAKKADKTAKRTVGLPRAVQPTCGADGFGKPSVSDITSTETRGRAWALQYTAKSTAKPGAIKTILLVEVDPGSPLPKKLAPKVKRVTIDGIRVRLRRPDRKTSAFTAQWRTDRAVYSLVAVGRDTKTVERFITCLP